MSGYVSLQEQAGIPIIKYLRAGGDAGQALDDIDELFRASVALRTRHA
jgi:hypothetical protein